MSVAPVSQPVDGSKQLTFSYDYNSRRVRKQVWTWATDNWQLTTDSRFVYDGWNVVEVLNGLASNQVVKKYTWGLDLSGLNGNSTVGGIQGAGGIGGLLATVESGTTGSPAYWFFYDANGNVGQVIQNTTGYPVVAHYEYDPYGNAIVASGTYATTNPVRFSTKWLDTETGLYYYIYRYYSPRLGRWISRDPIGERGGENLQGFVLNRPMDRFDALGHACCGLDLTAKMNSVFNALQALWPAKDAIEKKGICHSMLSTGGWDIDEFAWNKSVLSGGGCGTAPQCAGTVTVSNQCYPSEEVNYWLWGWANRACNDAGIVEEEPWWRTNNGSGPRFPVQPYRYTLQEALELVRNYRLIRWGGTGIPGRVAWTQAGWNGALNAFNVRVACSRCRTPYKGALTVRVGRGRYTIEGAF